MSPCGQDPDAKVRVYGLLRTLEFKGLRDLGFRVVVFMLSLEQLDRGPARSRSDDTPGKCLCGLCGLLQSQPSPQLVSIYSSYGSV